MSARTFEAGSDGWCRHRLLALGVDVGDLVEAAGGFLCDRARAGWDVTVVATDAETSRSLAILGVATGAVTDDIVTAVRELAPGGAVAVAPDLLLRNARLRHELARPAGDGSVEILVWGSELGPGFDPVGHPVSAAARAFKSHALTAAGRMSRDGHTETLYRVRPAALRRLRAV